MATQAKPRIKEDDAYANSLNGIVTAATAAAMSDARCHSLSDSTVPVEQLVPLPSHDMPLSVLLRTMLGNDDMDMLRDSFILLDSDGDGFITREELSAAVLAVMGEERYRNYLPYLIRIFEAADKDQDERLNLKEYLECFAEGPGILPQEVIAECVRDVQIRMTDEEIAVLQRCFFRLDSNEDGLLDEDELREGMKAAMAEKFPQIEDNEYASMARNAIAQADTDRDGMLNISEFIRSFQLDTGVIPVPLLEHKPEGLLESLRKEERDLLRVALMPIITEEPEYATYQDTQDRISLLVYPALRGTCSEEDIAAIIEAFMIGAQHHPDQQTELVTVRPLVRKFALQHHAGAAERRLSAHDLQEYSPEAVRRKSLQAQEMDTDAAAAAATAAQQQQQQQQNALQNSCVMPLTPQNTMATDAAGNSVLAPTIMNMSPTASGRRRTSVTSKDPSTSPRNNSNSRDEGATKRPAPPQGPKPSVTSPLQNRGSNAGADSNNNNNNNNNNNTGDKEEEPQAQESEVLLVGESFRKVEKVFRHLDADHDGYLQPADIQPLTVAYWKHVAANNEPPVEVSQEIEDRWSRLALLKFYLANVSHTGLLTEQEFCASFFESPSELPAGVSENDEQAAADKELLSTAGYVGVLPPTLVEDIVTNIVADLTPDAKLRLHRALQKAMIEVDKQQQQQQQQSQQEEGAEEPPVTIPLVHFEGMLDKEFPGEADTVRELLLYCDPDGTGEVDPGFVAQMFNIDMEKVVSEEPEQQEQQGEDSSAFHGGNVNKPIPVVSVEGGIQDGAPYLTPYELAQLGSALHRLSPQHVVSSDVLRTSLQDIFVPSRSANNNNDAKNVVDLPVAQRFDMIVDKVSAAAGKDKAGRLCVADLSARFDKFGPVVLDIGMNAEPDGVTKAIEVLNEAGIDEWDRRKICEKLVEMDRTKEGTMDLTQAQQELARVLSRGHPGWSVSAIQRPIMAILNSATLNTQGHISLTRFIHAFASQHYIIPIKHSEPHAGALSRRLDLTDISKLRTALAAIVDVPVEEQPTQLLEAVRKESIVSDSSSLHGIVNTVIACLRTQRLSPAKLSDKLGENTSAVSFPLMLARDCHEVCLRKLTLSLPTDSLRIILRTLLLMDVRGDGLLQRAAVESALTGALTEYFVHMQETSTAETPQRRLAGVMTSERIYDVVRLIVLSQYEHVNTTRYHHTQDMSLAAAAGRRELEMSGFIDCLINDVNGTILPREYLPNVEVDFRLALSFDEVEMLKTALTTIAEDRRGIITAGDLKLILSNSLSQRRQGFVTILEDALLRLADGPEGARYDMSEITKHFEVTQKKMIIHTNRFSEAAAERVASRVIRREKVRKITRVYLALDTKKDGFLDHEELDPSLTREAMRSLSDQSMVKQMVAVRYKDLDLDKNGIITYEEFLASFSMGCFPALSDPEMDATLKHQAAVWQQEEEEKARRRAANQPHYLAMKAGPCSPVRYGMNGMIVPTALNEKGEVNVPSPVKAGALVVATTNYDDISPTRMRYMCPRATSNVAVFNEELQDLFNSYDIDGNGYLDRKEFARAYRQLEFYGLRPTEAEVEAMFRKVCRSDDRVTFEEFCVLMLKRSKM